MDEDLARMVELARPEAGMTALDVAPDGGHAALALAPRVASVTALDLTPEMREAARMPFEDATFDIVTCRIAAHHFADVSALVKEARRVLRPGGTLVIEDHEAPMDAATAQWIESFERLRDPGHVRSLSALEWRGTLESRGFLVREIEHFESPQELGEWAARQACAADTVARLAGMMASAPPLAASWYRMRGEGETWRFVIPQVLLAASR